MSCCRYDTILALVATYYKYVSILFCFALVETSAFSMYNAFNVCVAYAIVMQFPVQCAHTVHALQLYKPVDRNDFPYCHPTTIANSNRPNRRLYIFNVNVQLLTRATSSSQTLCTNLDRLLCSCITWEKYFMIISNISNLFRSLSKLCHLICVLLFCFSGNGEQGVEVKSACTLIQRPSK